MSLFLETSNPSNIVIAGNGPSLNVNELKPFLKNHPDTILIASNFFSYYTHMIVDFLCINDEVFFKDPRSKYCIKKAKKIISSIHLKKLVRSDLHHKFKFIHSVNLEKWLDWVHEVDNDPEYCNLNDEIKSALKFPYSFPYGKGLDDFLVTLDSKNSLYNFGLPLTIYFFSIKKIYVIGIDGGLGGHFYNPNNLVPLTYDYSHYSDWINFLHRIEGRKNVTIQNGLC